MIGGLARHGVALRIFLGLFLLSFLLLAATAIAIYSFQRTSNTFRDSAETQIGSLHFAAQLRQHTQAIAALAPGLIARDFDQGAVIAFSVEIFKEQGALLALIDRLSGLLPGDQSLESLKDTAGKLVENTDAMSTAIYDRVVLKDQLNARIAQLAALHDAVAEFYLNGETLDQASLRRLQKAFDAINALALRALTLKTTDEVSLLASQAALHLSEATIVAGELARMRSEILSIADGIADFANGSDGFFEQRSQLLRADFEVSDLLAKSDRIAAKLSGEVDAVIAKIDTAIAGENEQLAATLSDRTRFLVILGGFGILAAIGIAAFTQVSVIGRLNRLRRAMSGGLSDDQNAQDADFGKEANGAVIGLTKSGDEIAEMARAVVGYVEKLRQSDAEAKRSQQRLEAAIESMPGGFSLYDADDKLVVCNTRYRELFFPGDGAGPQQGQSFESVLSAVLARGLLVLPEGTESAWLMDRLKSHRAPQGQVSLLRRRDGRWVEINERRAQNGDVVSIYSDVTQRQAFEAQLIEARTRAEAAREVADKRSGDLARLSEKLSKYLSPQIYSSIFAAGHDVVVAPQRKKLTVFFSDIADFAETTDNLESEDLTELLNDYLTEMSRIALEHGATIDKYIGDAIMIFFGDPDTKGVEEDARACVKMAIAMQRRMQELGEHWKSRGVQRPFRMRIAINTGFCTVGNFGSADRMDYTIIGSEVNLAARLQSHAELGGILLSHSTKALVGELVSTAELEPVTVKGFVEPVRVYRVLGILDTLENDGKTIQVELDGAQIKVDMARLSADDRRRLHDVAQVLVERLTKGA